MAINNGAVPDAEPLTREHVAELVKEGIEDAMRPITEMFQQWNRSQPTEPTGDNFVPAAGGLGAAAPLLEMVLPHILPAIMNKVLNTGPPAQTLDGQLNGLAALMNTVNNVIIKPQADRDMDNIRSGINYGVTLSSNAFRATGTFPVAETFVAENQPMPVAPEASGPLQANNWRNEVAGLSHVAAAA